MLLLAVQVFASPLVRLVGHALLLAFSLAVLAAALSSSFNRPLIEPTEREREREHMASGKNTSLAAAME